MIGVAVCREACLHRIDVPVVEHGKDKAARRVAELLENLRTGYHGGSETIRLGGEGHSRADFARPPYLRATRREQSGPPRHTCATVPSFSARCLSGRWTSRTDRRGP